MEEQTTATATSGATPPAEQVHEADPSAEVDDFLNRNAELRREFLRCNEQIRQAKAAGDSRAEARARRARSKVGDKFVRLNKRLSMHDASAFMIRGDDSRRDLEQSALLGMWEAFVGTAADKVDLVDVDVDGNVHAKSGWDPDRSTFATLARSHIRGQVSRAVKRTESAYVGMSYGTWTARPKVEQAKTELAAALGRTPTVDEIAARAEVSIDTVRVCLTAAPVSLDATLPGGDTDGGATLGDVIAAKSAEREEPDRELADRALAVAAEGTLNYQAGPGFGGMPANQVAVLLLRNGLHEGPERLLYETAGLLCVGRGVIGTAEKRARAAVAAIPAQLMAPAYA